MMPGPVSDSFDPEWGTASNGQLIDDRLGSLYEQLTVILDGREPMYVLDLVQSDDQELDDEREAVLTIREWRLLRFAIERARESL